MNDERFERFVLAVVRLARIAYPDGNVVLEAARTLEISVREVTSVIARDVARMAWQTPHRNRTR